MVIIHLFPSLCSKVVFENLKFVVVAKEHVVGRYNTGQKLGEMILMFMVYLMRTCRYVGHFLSIWKLLLFSHSWFCCSKGEMAYRPLYILNWICRYLTQTHFNEWISCFSGLIQTALYADFFYYYFIRYTTSIPILSVLSFTLSIIIITQAL
uniref:Uncharacterized protein n=1 Tax=Lactuca sativa TaxID=4236 RepID=A0A9R1XFC7_LACSA|nr:hypothetical protein LSAT_V11C400165580 [Lactuca sativa]